jgi:cobalt-zinc-cadmium efflux system outer membrane protein
MILRLLGVLIIFLVSGINGLCGNDDLHNSLTLEEAISRALEKNSELAAFSWDIRAREAGVRQMKLLPNPSSSVFIEDVGGSGSFEGMERSQTTLQLSQLIELGGKRARRVEVVSLARDQAQRDYQIKRLEVIALVSKAFIDVLGSQERVVLTQEMVHVAENVVETVSERVKAGKVSPIEMTKSEVALTMVQIELEHAIQDLEADRRRLSSLWGDTIPNFKEASGNLDYVHESMPTLDELIGKVLENPELTRWDVEVARREATLNMENSKRIPDLTLSGGYRWLNETEDHTFVAGVAFPLPLFDRNQGGILESRSQLEKVLQEKNAAQIRIKNRLREAHNNFVKTGFELDRLKEKVMPGAKMAFDAVEEGYRMGKFGYLDVLDAQKTLFESRLRYLQALVNYRKEIMEIERWTGGAMDMNKERKNE